MGYGYSCTNEAVINIFLMMMSIYSLSLSRATKQKSLIARVSRVKEARAKSRDYSTAVMILVQRQISKTVPQGHSHSDNRILKPKYFIE
jgi:hypothetical protein